MVRKYLDKFIRIVYDDLKFFLVFFLFFQIGILYIDIRLSFLVTVLFSSLSFFINGTFKSERHQKFMPVLGIVLSFVLSVVLYKDHTLYDKLALTLYHVIIWLVGARNLRARVMAKRTMMYLFMPIIVITLLLFGVYLSGIRLDIMLGQIYHFVMLFYAVTFMLAVKTNLDEGYKSEKNRTVNTINRQKNRVIFSYIPNLMIVVIFAFVLSMNFEVYTPPIPEQEGVEVESETNYAITELEDEEQTEFVERDTSDKEKKPIKEEESKAGFDLNLDSAAIFKFVTGSLGLFLMLYFLYKVFVKTYHKKFEEDEEDLLEIRESLLTKENIRSYLNKLADRFKRKPQEKLPRERHLYKKMIQKLIKEGKSFEIHETPEAYQDKVKDDLLSEMTPVYEAYRYGEKKAPVEQLNQFEQKLNDK